jgi:hypothetical protein
MRLVSPFICEYAFSEHNILYAAALGVAKNLSLASIDLHNASLTYVNKIGADAAHRLNRLPSDNTHLWVKKVI